VSRPLFAQDQQGGYGHFQPASAADDESDQDGRAPVQGPKARFWNRGAHPETTLPGSAVKRRRCAQAFADGSRRIRLRIHLGGATVPS